MGYQVGIDLGTTFTAAAVHRDGRSNIFSLGSQAASIPSVVLLREDETELTGEAAVRRALTEPERVAREFKRRLGDTTPIIVGGSPYSAEQLMARLLKATLAEIEKREGAAPDRIAITHPANWGPYKIDLLNQAVRLAGLNADQVDLLTEPEAAAISYATQQRVEPGEVIAVYDLGGGTFDAAVLRRTADGFEILGRPEGIERMGGIDFDAAVFAHVNRALDGKLQELDPEDPMVMSGVARLREDCINAKIALSSDTDATIPVLLPNLQADVRVTRAEFEALIRPSLADSIGAMHRALETAGITPADVSKVLLVGGSSRIPLIGQLVSSELDRPVAVDADPKHAIALGAAAFAGGALSSTGGGATGGGAGAAGAAAAGVAAAGALPPIVPAPEPVVLPTESVPAAPPPAAAAPHAQPAAQPAAPAQAVAPTTQQPAAAPTQQQPVTPVAPAAPTGSGGAPASPEKSKVPMIVGGVVAAAVLGVGAFIAFGGSGDDDATVTTTPGVTVAPDGSVDPSVTQNPDVSQPNTVPGTTAPVETVAPPTDEELFAQVAGAVGAIDPNIAASVTGGVATLSGLVAAESAAAAVSAAGAIEGITGVDDAMTLLAADEVCTDLIQSQPRWACITSATFDGSTINATYADNGTVWDTGSNHLHFFTGELAPDKAGASGDGVSSGNGGWIIWDQAETFTGDPNNLAGSPTRLCVRVALSDHSLESLDSGNCFPVTNTSGGSGFRSTASATPTPVLTTALNATAPFVCGVIDTGSATDGTANEASTTSGIVAAGDGPRDLRVGRGNGAAQGWSGTKAD